MNVRHSRSSYRILLSAGLLMGIAPSTTGCSRALTGQAMQDAARAYVQAEFNQSYAGGNTTNAAPVNAILTSPPFRRDLQALSYYAGRASALSLFGRGR